MSKQPEALGLESALIILDRIGYVLEDDVRVDQIAAEIRRLHALNAELVEALANLHALVWGECPSLLNEDSGGNSNLDMQIIDILKKATEAA